MLTVLDGRGRHGIDGVPGGFLQLVVVLDGFGFGGSAGGSGQVIWCRWRS